MIYPKDFNDKLRNKPICGPLAIAMVSDRTLQEAITAIEENLMPFQRTFSGRTYYPQIVMVLDQFNIKATDLGISNITLEKWMRDIDDGTYLVLVSGHALVVRNHLVCDQKEIGPVDRHPTRQRMIMAVLQISS